MDIKSISQNALGSRVNDTPNSSAKSTGSSVSGYTSDKVTLTDMSSQVQELEKKASTSNIDNSERIAQIKAAIADGSYQVDVNKVASKLIQTEVLFSNS